MGRQNSSFGRGRPVSTKRSFLFFSFFAFSNFCIWLKRNDYFCSANIPGRPPGSLRDLLGRRAGAETFLCAGLSNGDTRSRLACARRSLGTLSMVKHTCFSAFIHQGPPWSRSWPRCRATPPRKGLAGSPLVPPGRLPVVSWRLPGAPPAPSWQLLAPLGRLLALFWRLFGASWCLCGASWRLVAVAGGSLAPSWRLPGGSWRVLGVSWRLLAPPGAF